MLRFSKTKVAKEKFYGAKKKKKILRCWCWSYSYLKMNWNKNNSKHLIGYLDDVIKSLVLILTKMSGDVKTFKKKNNKLTSLCIDDDKLLKRCKTI